VTEQEAVPIGLAPWLKVQAAELLNVPESLDVNETDPVGVVAFPASVSVAVAVHVVASFTAIEDGEQLTVVEVVRLVAVRANAEAVLLE
jgi:hypothetical protein